MTNDALLDILKWALLGLLYLFFARVLYAVWSELRAPRPVTDRMMAEMAAITALPDDPTMASPPPIPMQAPAAVDPTAHTGRQQKVKGKRGTVSALVVLEPRAQRGRAFALDGEITIGRADTCTIVLTDDPYISTLHAHVVRDGGTVYVEDLHSTNGSYLNGERLTTRRRLDQGDRLQFGQTLLEAQ